MSYDRSGSNSCRRRRLAPFSCNLAAGPAGRPRRGVGSSAPAVSVMARRSSRVVSTPGCRPARSPRHMSGSSRRSRSAGRRHWAWVRVMTQGRRHQDAATVAEASPVLGPATANSRLRRAVTRRQPHPVHAPPPVAPRCATGVWSGSITRSRDPCGQGGIIARCQVNGRSSP
jgi:hypothetical protein